jgi:septal ring factor EnvC (AmiA/AmiB activator)
MARATTGAAKAVKRSAAGLLRGTAKTTAKVLPTSKEELRARVEKLERANANLRIKNKEFRRIAEEAAERLEALQTQLEANERKVARQLKRDGSAQEELGSDFSATPDRTTRAKRMPRKYSDNPPVIADGMDSRTGENRDQEAD